MASPKLRAFRERALYRLLVVVSAIGRRIPLRIGQFLGRRLGELAWYVARRDRKKALANLAIAFPDWPEAQKRETIRAMFRHLGMSVFELAWMPNLTRESRAQLTVIEGLDRIMELIDAGRGVVTFTAHCGNWEWLSYITGMCGRPVSVLQRERDSPEMNRYITALRRTGGVQTIDRGSSNSARDLIAAIRRGGMLAFVLDQNIRTESVKVPFFGKPALTPIGPARIAIRTEAVAVVATIERLGDGRHHVRFGEPIELKRGEDPVALTARVTLAIEEQIRRAPAQWVWMHDRWRERPRWELQTKSAGE
ncbi:MAG TPA: lysophospholipid acyltransferase family protein [Thermoanaerobaculia bacterium]|nr:lysophospholipid acyltransferase family protein [Thermoanaerobaculia bacterium]